MEIKQVTSLEFKAYGRVITGYDCRELIRLMEEITPVPEAVVYVPSVPELEALPVIKELEKNFYGQMPIQAGYCNGHNRLLNAAEYHRSSEINVAAADMILILGRQQDVEEDYTYDTSKMEAFFVPAGTMVEMYATTLHYAPCHADGGGFRCVVVLPRGTNMDMEEISGKNGEDALLFAANKWLIGHEEGGLPSHAFIGLKGKNLSADQ